MWCIKNCQKIIELKKLWPFKVKRVKNSKIQLITTLVLGSRLKQGLAKVRANSEARESHFMLLGVRKNGRK